MLFVSKKEMIMAKKVKSLNSNLIEMSLSNIRQQMTDRTKLLNGEIDVSEAHALCRQNTSVGLNLLRSSTIAIRDSKMTQ